MRKLIGRTQGIFPSHRAEVSGMGCNTLSLKISLMTSRACVSFSSPASSIFCLNPCYYTVHPLYSRHSDAVSFSDFVLSYRVHVCLTYSSIPSLPGKFQLPSSSEISPVSKLVLDVSFAEENNLSLLHPPIAFLPCCD